MTFNDWLDRIEKILGMSIDEIEFDFQDAFELGAFPEEIVAEIRLERFIASE